jgi:NADH-quinone oxidoreductase subunit N
MLLSLLSNLAFYVPEMICIFLMCFLLIMEATYKKETGRTWLYVTSLIGLGTTLIVLIGNMSLSPVKIFADAVVIDTFSTLTKILMVLGTIFSIYIASISKDIYEELKAEFVIMAVGVLVGGMLLASANNLLTLYLGIETLSILSYVMSSFKRNDSASNEAGLKYALYGGITAGVMLFGMSHMYGIFGSIQFEVIAAGLAKAEGVTLWAGFASIILFFVGIGYKIACAPFHMWSPDVYQGSPIPVTSFFSIVPKLAGMAVLLRVSTVLFANESGVQGSWIFLLHVVAALTMSVGNITAITQDSVKRLLAFSSIGHVGMMLLGVLVLDEVGVRAILFYGIIYLFMTIVAFTVTSHLADKYGNDSMSSFKGIAKKHPYVAIAMMFALFSLAGVPPFAGFIAKFNIFSAVISKGYYGIALVAAINSVIALYYYMRIVRVMVFEKAEYEEPVESLGFKNQGIIVVMSLPLLVLGIFWDGIMHVADMAHIFIK